MPLLVLSDNDSQYELEEAGSGDCGVFAICALSCLLENVKNLGRDTQVILLLGLV